LLFKSVSGDGERLVHAVLMLLAAVGFLAGLGAYVCLGAQAEYTLLHSPGNTALGATICLIDGPG